MFPRAKVPFAEERRFHLGNSHNHTRKLCILLFVVELNLVVMFLCRRDRNRELDVWCYLPSEREQLTDVHNEKSKDAISLGSSHFNILL